jgi:hypothetical protein
MMVCGLDFWFNLNNIMRPGAFFKPAPAPSTTETGKKERDPERWTAFCVFCVSRRFSRACDRIRAGRAYALVVHTHNPRKFQLKILRFN